jgi:hypothetical protein
MRTTAGRINGSDTSESKLPIVVDRAPAFCLSLEALTDSRENLAHTMLQKRTRFREPSGVTRLLARLAETCLGRVLKYRAKDLDQSLYLTGPVPNHNSRGSPVIQPDKHVDPPVLWRNRPFIVNVVRCEQTDPNFARQHLKVQFDPAPQVRWPLMAGRERD